MPGEPSYIELGVPDVPAAARFYAQLLGWETAAVGQGGQVTTPTLDIGIHGGDEGAHFEVFFAVPDVESAVRRLRELGGEALGGINDSPGFGRWVECRDDQGVRFGLRQPA